jgi:hypothetical protein
MPEAENSGKVKQPAACIKKYPSKDLNLAGGNGGLVREHTVILKNRIMADLL